MVLGLSIVPRLSDELGLYVVLVCVMAVWGAMAVCGARAVYGARAVRGAYGI